MASSGKGNTTGPPETATGLGDTGGREHQSSCLCKNVESVSGATLVRGPTDRVQKCRKERWRSPGVHCALITPPSPYRSDILLQHWLISGKGRPLHSKSGLCLSLSGTSVKAIP